MLCLFIFMSLISLVIRTCYGGVLVSMIVGYPLFFGCLRLAEGLYVLAPLLAPCWI